jgi:post-segregation antitoxin (ccd killing protein)
MPTAKKAPKKKPRKAVGPPRKPLKIIEALSRRTITIKQETEKAINELVGPRKFSAFVQTALDHQLQSERIDQWLAEREAAREGKPLSPEAVDFAEKAWRSRK